MSKESYKISIVISGRDDNHGGEDISFDFITRLKKSVENNFSKLSKLTTVQYVIVDWSPIDKKYLYKNDNLLNIFNNPNFKNIIVEQSAIEKTNHNPTKFYDLSAKNVGIRRSDGEYVLITNTDNLFTDELCENIIKAIEEDDLNTYYRPYSRIDVDKDLNIISEGLSFPKNGLYEDEYVGTPAAGDFVLLKKSTLINTGKGYIETYINNSNKDATQTYVDAWLVMNLANNGVKPKMINGSFYSFHHNKDHRSNMAGPGLLDKSINYDNFENWGMLNFPEEIVNNNTIKVI
jgi:hypothetical protein